MFNSILHAKRNEIANVANKLRSGLFKIDHTSKKVSVMTLDLESATAIVTRYTKECDEFLREIQDQTDVADKQKTEVDEKSIKIKQEEIASRKAYNLAMTDLEKTMPALDEAMEVKYTY